jgi:phage protein D
MLTVNHRITVGSTTYTSAQHTRLVGLQTHAALSTPVNRAWITLTPVLGLSVTPGNAVSVVLGYGDNLHTVFTGVVEAVEWGMAQVALRAASASRALVGTRLNRFYEKSKAGDIVSHVAGLLDVATGSVESGLEFQAYALSDGMTAYDGLRRLAERCGFELYTDVDDKLVFAQYAPAQKHPFQFGVNILSLYVDQPTETVTGVEVYGESPSSFGQGQEAYSWLTKKDVKGTAGDSAGMTWRRFDPAARTQEDAGKIAQAALAALSAKRACTLKVVGAPQVQLGDAVDISQMPLDDQNGTFKVIGVAHRLDAKQGFYSVIAGLDV